MNKRKMDENAIDQTQITKQSKILRDKPIPEKSAVVFDFMMSLQNIVMGKIIINLWMKPDIQQEIVICIHNFCISHPDHYWDDEIKWDEFENEIVAKISKFSLPHLISSKLTYIVPAVGQAMRQWIKHFDEVLFHASKYRSKYSSVDLISSIIWTARGKINYAQTARNILANPDICLSEDTKFKIACIFCLEDKIALLAPNVLNEDLLDNVDRFMRPMVFFWSTRIAGHNIETTLRDKIESKFYFHYHFRQTHLSINEIIFQILIKNDWDEITFYEVAITHVWNKLTTEEKARNITASIKKMSDHGLMYTLLSNLDYEQQQDIFKEYSSLILDGILEDWSWEEYFLPTVLHFLDVMKPTDFLGILHKVTEGIIDNSDTENKFMYNRYKSVFKELWGKCSRNLKDFVFEHEHGCILRDILLLLPCKQNMDIICLILNDLNTQRRKNVVSGQYGIECCSLLIRNDMWDALKQFIPPSLFFEDYIIKLKQAFVTDEGHEIVEHFLSQNALDKIENFMTWAFNSKKEIDQFRKSLSCTVIRDATLDSIITHKKADFTELENHFNWCAKGNLKMINEFKAEVPKSFGDRFISHLIENDHCDLLEKVLNWCFLDYQQKIVQFKSNMYKDDKLARCIKSITINLIKKDNYFTMLEKFLHWCFIDEHEVKEYKTWLLYPDGYLFNVCAELLICYDLELADKFLNWCVTSSEEVCKYKNTLMLSTRDMEYILNSVRDVNQTDLQLLIKWFSPSKVTLQEFHSQLLKRKLCLYKKSMYEWLPEFIESLIILKDKKKSAF